MDENFMKKAIQEALIAKSENEIPIGAVIVKDGKVIAKAHNKRDGKKNALCHAEVCAIDKACKKMKSWRLEGAEIYVTLEPCLMCIGAIYNARISAVYYGASNTRQDGYEIDYTKPVLNHKLKTEGGVLEKECAELMKNFFDR